MTDIEHPESFHGLPVLTLPGPARPGADPLPAADAVAWRLESAWEGDLTFAALWEHFLGTVDTSGVRALLIGPWWQEDYSPFAPVVELLCAHADRFPALRALFLADVVSEECELSWLEMSDITPVVEAFGQLEELTVRGCGEPTAGAEALALRPVRHMALRSLRFESGGLPVGVVRAIGGSELPALEHLELWLGVPEYGGDATVDDLAPLLSGGAFPKLRHLGLQNSEIQDEIATAVAAAPVVARLESLSLAMGTLSDIGAEALLAGQPLTHLTLLDLHHHYISDPLIDRLRRSVGPDGVNGEPDEVGYWDPDEDDERYVAVSE
ncbi:STM4015 family protein [Streptomyces sp. NPDC005318]|uniref:STM4015 family protein n=1 Tax=Streptomyces sp. NPDC005318 TaxID=3157031 RepID=UPI0033AD2C15